MERRSRLRCWQTRRAPTGRTLRPQTRAPSRQPVRHGQRQATGQVVNKLWRPVSVENSVIANWTAGTHLCPHNTTICLAQTTLMITLGPLVGHRHSTLSLLAGVLADHRRSVVKRDGYWEQLSNERLSHWLLIRMSEPLLSNCVFAKHNGIFDNTLQQRRSGRPLDSSNRFRLHCNQYNTYTTLQSRKTYVNDKDMCRRIRPKASKGFERAHHSSR